MTRIVTIFVPCPLHPQCQDVVPVTIKTAPQLRTQRPAASAVRGQSICQGCGTSFPSSLLVPWITASTINGALARLDALGPVASVRPTYAVMRPEQTRIERCTERATERATAPSLLLSSESAA